MESSSARTAKRPKSLGKSCTADILGRRSRNGKPQAKWAEHFKILTELRDRLCGNKNARTESAHIEISMSGEHLADAATDSYDRDWALAMASSDQTAMYEIDEALNRIQSGSYGTCELTGKNIEAARLKAIPWTRFCAAAQAELEERGLCPRTQLGDLGGWTQSAETEKPVEDELEEAGTGKSTTPAGEQ